MNPSSLNAIIQLKQWKEDEIKSELLKIKQIIATHERDIKRLEEDFSMKVHEAMQRRHAQMEAELLQEFHHYLQDLTKALEEKKQLLKRRIDELKKTENALIQAYQERRIAENLKERIVHDRQLIERKTETKTLDELAVRRMSR
ncbi:MAG: hypothetical protein D6778_08525 [Nitrospirae bacterium]|nr:MAG: hypothetical protein D6778_08525 [Nitrospirota bacterium]